MPVRNCDHCGKQYTYERAHTRFCSDECRQKEYRAQKNADPTATRLKEAIHVMDELLETDAADIALHASDYDRLIKMTDRLYAKVGSASVLQRNT